MRPWQLVDLVESAHLAVPVTVVGYAAGVTVASVTCATATCEPGSLFCCIPGVQRDGHDFAREAVDAGAVAVLASRRVDVPVPQVLVPGGSERQAMAEISSAFWGHPAEKLTVVGVTGTNGKTTVTHMLASIFRSHGWRSSVIGTLSGTLTTPDSPELQALLARKVRDGEHAVAMEVSSHGLAAHRVDGIVFDVAVFTNLGRDHLDFHHTMENYFSTKSALFTAEHARCGVVSVDDEWGRKLAEAADIPIDQYSIDEVTDLRPGPGGSTFLIGDQEIEVPVPGLFNVRNALAAAHTARNLGIAIGEVADGLRSMEPVPGRMERVISSGRVSVYVDFAHTPEALEAVLDATREIASGAPVVVVFGCGGDRDRSKRPVMGALAARKADIVVVTSDNPRSEDPDAIVEEILSGVPDELRARVLVEADRERAIGLALEVAPEGAVVLVAGKGHETGQEVAGRRLPFDDHEVVARLAGSPSGGGGRR